MAFIPRRIGVIHFVIKFADGIIIPLWDNDMVGSDVHPLRLLGLVIQSDFCFVKLKYYGSCSTFCEYISLFPTRHKANWLL